MSEEIDVVDKSSVETLDLTLEPTKKLIKKDIRLQLEGMGQKECRYLVDLYYQIQDSRKVSGNQLKAAQKQGEQAAFIGWAKLSMQNIEESIAKALDIYTDKSLIGKWCKSIIGIGPVLSAGLIAYVDINKCPTAGHIWSFAGLDPTVKWEKGEKRPWCTSFKTICAFLIGESFIKQKDHPDCFYGKIYVKRKLLEQERNDAGMFVDQAVEKLKRFNISPATDAYKWYSGQYPAGTTQIYAALELTDEEELTVVQKNSSGKKADIVTALAAALQAKKIEYLKSVLGKPGSGQPMLPPAHIHARARRKAVMIFLSHFHHVAYACTFNCDPPKPYMMAIKGHAHYLPIPNWTVKDKVFPNQPSTRPLEHILKSEN